MRYVSDRHLKNLSVAWCSLVWTFKNNLFHVELDSWALQCILP